MYDELVRDLAGMGCEQLNPVPATAALFRASPEELAFAILTASKTWETNR